MYYVFRIHTVARRTPIRDAPARHPEREKAPHQGRSLTRCPPSHGGRIRQTKIPTPFTPGTLPCRIEGTRPRRQLGRTCTFPTFWIIRPLDPVFQNRKLKNTKKGKPRNPKKAILRKSFFQKLLRTCKLKKREPVNPGRQTPDM